MGGGAREGKSQAKRLAMNICYKAKVCHGREFKVLRCLSPSSGQVLGRQVRGVVPCMEAGQWGNARKGRAAYGSPGCGTGRFP